jgi:threonine/homoserine/homoserine lactone efflux protein
VRQAISEVLPYAVGVAISPIPIIAVILMLFSNRAKTNGPAFLLGWIIGLAVVVGVVYALAEANDVATDSGASDGSSTVQVVLGVVLLVLALRNWRKRPGPGEEATMPKWMATIDAFTPVKAFGLAVVLSAVNPKNLIISVGAAAAVAQAGESTSDSIVALAVFVILASLSIAVPVFFYLLGGARAKAVLDGWKAWLSANNAAVMAVLLLVFGVVLIGKGTGHFS